MALQQELEKSGSWLFRYRSFIPLLVVPLCAFCLFSTGNLMRTRLNNEIWQLACLIVSLAGFAIRIVTVGHAPEGTSGRNTKRQVAETLTTTGMYSIVRNPLYVGNYFILLGFLATFQNVWLVLLISCLYLLFYERIIMAEEAFLREKFGKTFEQWAEKTPGFIPKFSHWHPPVHPFSWQTVLAREYNAFFVITTFFSVADLAFESLAAGQLSMDPAWMAAFIAGVLVFIVLRTLKRRTLVLKVAGR
ncbi:MAG TPA: isoprenylcysteine carboxylmethyltransferase family protein [bacterium]|jgi:protein-S-isoprenylcysteine O-methyltransferase Ste14|nr:isoprenylcysteine carboxylmethyltransferase family protein [bacterium]